MRFRFHLSTWIVLFLAASILLGLHISPQDYRVKTGNDGLHVITYGFPIICSEQESHRSGSSSMDAQPEALFNFIIILLPLAFFLEPDSRRLCSFKNAPALFSLLIALGIGLELGVDSYAGIRYMASDTRMDMNLRANYEKQDFYRRGWPFSVYAGFLETSKEPGKFVLTTSSGDQQILSGSLTENTSKLTANIHMPWPLGLGNLIATLFITATIFILTLLGTTWLSANFRGSTSPPHESPN